MPLHLKSLTTRLIIAALVTAATLSVPADGVAQEGEVGTVEAAVNDVTGSGARKIGGGDPVYHMETVRTGSDSAVAINLIDESYLSIGADAELLLDSMVYDPNRGVVDGVIEMVSGIIHFRSSDVRLNVTIDTPSGSIGIRGTEFDVLAEARRTEVAVQEGTVEVTSAAGNQSVTAGEVYSFDADGNDSLSTTPSPQMAEAVAAMYATLSDSEATPGAATETASAPATSEEQVSGAVAEIQQSQPNVDLGNLVFLELDKGLVVIEALPDIAPGHAERVAELMNAGAYDNARFDFVRHGYAAEIALTGSPEGVGRGEPIAAEINEQSFTRGTVGMSRPPDDVDGATGAFFIALGDASNLDGQYTAWGRVVYGLETLDALAEGRPPASPDVILRARSASSVLGR
ncbi:MAG: peptidylprolyl isomerase [Rhodospirillales bacterium]